MHTDSPAIFLSDINNNRYGCELHDVEGGSYDIVYGILMR